MNEPENNFDTEKIIIDKRYMEIFEIYAKMYEHFINYDLFDEDDYEDDYENDYEDDLEDDSEIGILDLNYDNIDKDYGLDWEDLEDEDEE